jgi:hypothetical protein
VFVLRGFEAGVLRTSDLCSRQLDAGIEKGVKLTAEPEKNIGLGICCLEKKGIECSHGLNLLSWVYDADVEQASNFSVCRLNLLRLLSPLNIYAVH